MDFRLVKIENLRILLIDDDEDDYILTRDIVVDAFGKEVELDWVQDWQAAEDVIAEDRYDAYLVDYWLGSKKGSELVHDANRAGCFAPFIMLTGLDSREIDLEASHAGVVDYFVKDQLTPVQLERSVRYGIARKNVERSLIVANDAKSSFLAHMSHELRTPLNSIIGFSEIMGGILGELTPEKYTEYSGMIHRSGKHLLRIINDILDLSKIDAVEAELKISETSIRGILEECMEMMKVRSETGQITLSFEMECDEILVMVDRLRFKQILLNLITNAIKFTPRNGSVTLCAQLNSENELVASVTDTGMGIPEDKIDTILEPFQQAHDVMRRPFEGTGLGLTLVKRLMDCHGGRVVIESELHVGTCVSVIFPAERTLNTPQSERLATAS